MFGKMLFEATSRNLDMRGVLPWTLSNCGRNFKKTNKPAFAGHIEGSVASA